MWTPVGKQTTTDTILTHQGDVMPKPTARTKPSKPHKDFPLYAHASGRWAKKVKGKTLFFGKWDEPQKALEKWLDQKDDLLAGRKPRASDGRQISAADACNKYLDFIEDQVESGKKSEAWYIDNKRTMSIFLTTVGRNWAIESLTIGDFAEVSKTLDKTLNSPVTIRNHNHRVRGLFKWLKKSGLIDSIPNFGPAFDPPKQVEIDRHNDSKPVKQLSRREIRSLLRVSKDSNPQLYAAILLAINTGCQNKDIETLLVRHIDFKAGWYVQPRSKRAKKRRAKLWPRTIRAIKKLMENRGLRQDDLIFRSAVGKPYHSKNCISKEFKPIKDAAGILTANVGFQWIRHSFITEASQTGDLIAVQLACGHAPRSITENYIHSVYDARLEKISDHVNEWLTKKKK